MYRNFSKTKVLAIFFTAVLCFNVSGSLCLVHCQWMDMSAEMDHCPLAKMDKDNCPKAKESLENDSEHFAKTLDKTAIGCCDLNISFVSTYFEKQQNKVQTAKLSENPAYDFRPFEFKTSNRLSKLPARSPPKIDKRVERIKHSVFLI